jgi:hypothetical protein
MIEDRYEAIKRPLRSLEACIVRSPIRRTNVVDRRWRFVQLGGELHVPAAQVTFDNFNLVVAGIKGAIAVGVDLLFDTLMVSALDEVSAEYGLLAESVS